MNIDIDGHTEADGTTLFELIGVENAAIDEVEEDAQLEAGIFTPSEAHYAISHTAVPVATDFSQSARNPTEEAKTAMAKFRTDSTSSLRIFLGARSSLNAADRGFCFAMLQPDVGELCPPSTPPSPPPPSPPPPSPPPSPPCDALGRLETVCVPRATLHSQPDDAPMNKWLMSVAHGNRNYPDYDTSKDNGYLGFCLPAFTNRGPPSVPPSPQPSPPPPSPPSLPPMSPPPSPPPPSPPPPPPDSFACMLLPATCSIIAEKRYCFIVEAINKHGLVGPRISSNGVRACGPPVAGYVTEVPDASPRVPPAALPPDALCCWLCSRSTANLFQHCQPLPALPTQHCQPSTANLFHVPAST